MENLDNEGFAKDWLEAEKEFGERWLGHGPVEQFKKDSLRLFSRIVKMYSIQPPDASVKTEDRKINDDVTVRVYYPPAPTGEDAAIVHIHGGGYIIGDLNSEDAQCRVIVKACNVLIVSVNYRLAPQHKFPTALDDCIDAFRWLRQHTTSLGVDPKKLVISGTSAGGNLAIGAALKLIDGGEGDWIKGVVAVVPVTIHPSAVPAEMQDRYTSYEENAEKTGNTKGAMLTFFDAYAAPIDDKYTSVLLHDKLHDLPKTYIAECGMDVLRDDARLFKQALDREDVPNKYDAYPGYPHISWARPSKFLQEHRKLFCENLAAGIRFVLS